MEKLTSASASGAAASRSPTAQVPQTDQRYRIDGRNGATVLSSGSIDFFPSPGKLKRGPPVITCPTRRVARRAGNQHTSAVERSDAVELRQAGTVSARLKGAGTNAILFSLPVTIRSMVGGN